MAYNLQSLITIIEQILDPQQKYWVLYPNKRQLKSLLTKAVSLQQILENSPPLEIESLESQIREAVHKAEDIIESNMVDRMNSTSVVKWLIILFMKCCTFSLPGLEQVIQELASAIEQVAKLVEGKKAWTGGSLSGVSYSYGDSGLKSIVVGVDEDLMQLKDRLTRMKSKLEVIPIVGMGGIGKTTLARKLYQDLDIVYHFKHLAWTTISQDYNMKSILSDLLRCIIGKDFDKLSEKGSGDLKDILYRELYCRRYMIVLDDIWSIQAWDDIRRYFPDTSNGSRIVVTTRESDVARYVNSRGVQQLMSKSESWNLLRQIVFGEAAECPLVLQGIGTKIANDCGGAINVIGGLLSKLERSEHVWEHIGNDVKAAIAASDEHEQFSNILTLSYNHLPNHLKPCLLYMGAFPEDYEVKASRLVRLRVAEGFVKSNRNRSLEEEGEGYLKALVERNLVLVQEKKHSMQIF